MDEGTVGVTVGDASAAAVGVRSLEPCEDVIRGKTLSALPSRWREEQQKAPAQAQCFWGKLLSFAEALGAICSNIPKVKM